MHAPAHLPDIETVTDPAIDELNRIVEQAEELLKTLSDDGSEAASAVRDRVSDTLQQARARLADTAAEAQQVAETLADRTDRYVRANPWQSVVIAALLGGAVSFLLTKASRRGQ